MGSKGPDSSRLNYPKDNGGERLNKSLDEAQEKYVYFWKQTDIYSQWHRSEFVVDGQVFNCAEQYMMYTKAVLLHDDQQASRIMMCTDQAKMKKLGRGTVQYNEAFWREQCLHVVKEGNIAKFSQNEYLQRHLFGTYPLILVEASPYDSVWGIGLRKDNQAAWNEATWEGLNLLGYILTEVRDELMCEKGIIEESDKKVYFDQLMDRIKFELETDSKYDRGPWQAEAVSAPPCVKETKAVCGTDVDVGLQQPYGNWYGSEAPPCVKETKAVCGIDVDIGLQQPCGNWNGSEAPPCVKETKAVCGIDVDVGLQHPYGNWNGSEADSFSQTLKKNKNLNNQNKNTSWYENVKESSVDQSLGELKSADLVQQAEPVKAGGELESSKHNNNSLSTQIAHLFLEGDNKQGNKISDDTKITSDNDKGTDPDTAQNKVDKPEPGVFESEDEQRAFETAFQRVQLD